MIRPLILAALGLLVSLSALADEHAQEKAVLVTGASSGIGLAIAEKLASEGFHVYAGARKDADLEMLDAKDNMTAVRLDVTKQDEIDAAVALVEEAGRGLWGVVNNAGVGVFKPMSDMTEGDLDFVFDVNVYGPYRVNNAFAPLLVESGGRTTTIGSISGYLAGPGSGTYSMSKFAIEGYTDAYAAEMSAQGVHVSVIDPGGYKSEIRKKVALKSLGKTEEDLPDLSEDERAQVQQMIDANAKLKEPDEVADAALHVMSAESPRRRYMVVPNADQAERTIRAALGKVVQLNQDQPYTYSRDELIALLDEALAADY